MCRSSSLHELWWLKLIFTYNLSTRTICVWTFWGTASLTALFKILETCPSASHAKQLLEGIMQNKATGKITCVQSYCTTFQRKLFSEKTASCTVQSVEVYCTPHCYTLKNNKCLVFWVTFHNGMVLMLHKECHNKILIYGLVLVHHDSQRSRRP